MPAYNYLCPKCKTQFEKIVSKPDPDIPQKCPKCEAKSSSFIPIGKSGVSFRFNYLAPDA